MKNLGYLYYVECADYFFHKFHLLDYLHTSLKLGPTTVALEVIASWFLISPALKVSKNWHHCRMLSTVVKSDGKEKEFFLLFSEISAKNQKMK